MDDASIEDNSISENSNVDADAHRAPQQEHIVQPDHGNLSFVNENEDYALESSNAQDMQNLNQASSISAKIYPARDT